MSSSPELLQAGVAALKQKRYADAVQSLETFCQGQAQTRSRDFFQAQMYLVRAYQENGQVAQAVALCQEMAGCEHAQVRQWAQRTLPSLPAVESAPSVSEPQAPAASASAGTEDVEMPPVVAALLRPLSPDDLLPPDRADELLKTGNAALKKRQFAESVEALTTYLRGTDPNDNNEYAQAQMWLVKAYKGNEQLEAAIALCRHLLNHEKESVQIWAQQFLLTMVPAAPTEDEASPPVASARSAMGSPAFVNRAAGSESQNTSQPISKAGRSQRRGVKLSMKGVAANLAMASGVTVSLLTGMVLVLFLSLILITNSKNPTLGLGIALVITLVFNAAVFFISPWIMDLLQGWLYSTRWVSLAEVERHSPEAAKIIRIVCQQKGLQHPRLGIIDDNNPTAFTYGSLPNSARLVVSRGVFTYLDDDEVATVYAHELGHIVHWDFAVMTIASTLVQIAYLIYVYINELAKGLDKGQVKDTAQNISFMAYVFYVVGNYLVLYLSRTREYYADHFAAEVTGNPNGLSRGLVKIAYGILEEGQRTQQPSKVLQGMRTLGIADSRSAAFTGTAYRVASDPQKVGRVFLWDIFNPWAWWMELNSTHPLTGKRVRALTTYAEQLGLDTEFDMGRVIREGRTLNKQKLYGNFVLDVIIYWAEWIGLVLGLLVGIALAMASGKSMLALAFPLIGCGVGAFIKMVIMYPDFKRASETDVLTLMSDPYAGPLRGRAVKLEGTIIGRGDSGYKFGSDLKLLAPTGMIYLRYTSLFGPLGNFLFGMAQADSLVNRDVEVVGWFRRGAMPWLDLVTIDGPTNRTVTSHPRFSLLTLSILTIVVGIFLLWLSG